MKKTFDLKTWMAGTDRSVQRDGSRERAVTVRRHFDASIDRVWTAWTEGWKQKIVEGEARVGATVILDLGQPQKTTCTILACDAPTKLAATWSYGPVSTTAKPDEVEVRLADDGGRTLLVLEHRSENGSPWAAGVGAGWEAGLLMFELMFRGEDMSGLADTFGTLDATWTEFVASAR